MPIVDSSYRPPRWLTGPHILSMIGARLRRVAPVVYLRERIETPDGDFLDLDWSASGLDRVAVLSYGMEGKPQRPYVLGMVHALHAAGWDVVVWNYRGCSGEPNRKTHFYHGGLVDDLHAVIERALARGYPSMALIGFSLGGNLLLNYLGRRGRNVPKQISRAVAISTPVDVEDCARQMHKRSNLIYANLFLKSFRQKIRAKMRARPGEIDDRGFESIGTLEEYDACYTVPHFGFNSVPDFYRAVSSRYVAGNIAVPTLVINAADDPFMGPDCFPVEAARSNPRLFLEMPSHGGHIGFVTFGKGGRYWTEDRALEFIGEGRPPRLGGALAAVLGPAEPVPPTTGKATTPNP